MENEDKWYYRSQEKEQSRIKEEWIHSIIYKESSSKDPEYDGRVNFENMKEGIRMSCNICFDVK